jgi:NTE family protein
MKIDTLCFSSGGINGLMYISALKYLLDNNYIILNNIENYVGTSMGSIISFLLNIGYKPDELIDICLVLDFKKLQPEIDLEIIENEYGLDNGYGIIEQLESLCFNKLFIKNITFIELYNLTKKKLIINTTNFTNSKCTILNYINTPDLDIIKAIRMSCSIPVIYTPVLYNNCYYIDGALTKHILLDYCNPDTTLGFLINNKLENKINSILDIINGCILLTLNNNDYSKYKIINFNNKNISLINFDFDKEKILSIFNIGSDIAETFYLKELKDKIDKLKNEIEIKEINIIKTILDNIVNKIISN